LPPSSFAVASAVNFLRGAAANQAHLVGAEADMIDPGHVDHPGEAVGAGRVGRKQIDDRP
jgi:hypothetical protein